MQYGLIIITLFFFSINQNYAEPAKGITYSEGSLESSVQDSIHQKNMRLMLLPIVFRSPDTGFAVGILPQLIFRSSEASNPSTLRIDAYYTQKNQYHILLRSNNWVRREQLNLTGKLSLRQWPTSFYGIGNNTPAEWKESFTETLYDVNLGISKRVGSNFYLGGGALIRYGKISEVKSDGLLNAGTVWGSGNTFIAGINSEITYDTRDNHFFPANGSYHKLTLFGSFRSFGSDYTFLQIDVDARKYFSISRNQSLAVRAQGSISGGEVPFRILPSVGSSLRGYSSTRYIDWHMASVQFEYRVVPLFWRLGFVVFAGTGDVFNSFDDLRFNNLKHMVGIGLHYVFFRDEKINIRFDVSFGRESSGDYIDLSEAF